MEKMRMAIEDTSGVHVWLVLWKATSAIKVHALQSIDAIGLGQSDFAVLEALLHKGPLPVNAIGKKILLTSGSSTTAVDRLEKRQLVERKWEHEDRRVCLVHLTSSGRRLITKAFANHAETMERTAQGLTLQERGALLALLKKLGLHARDLLSAGAAGISIQNQKSKQK